MEFTFRIYAKTKQTGFGGKPPTNLSWCRRCDAGFLPRGKIICAKCEKEIELEAIRRTKRRQQNWRRVLKK